MGYDKENNVGGNHSGNIDDSGSSDLVLSDFKKFVMRDLELFIAYWEAGIERRDTVLEAAPFSDWMELFFDFTCRGISIIEEEEIFDDYCASEEWEHECPMCNMKKMIDDSSPVSEDAKRKIDAILTAPIHFECGF